ncbi:APH(3')-II family aminoglycoside O-phosphotransferase [Vineibacter terrae]|uniref:APH(3')-II family aminoglycoside O-phosphotransferase n=1 Tax=Vineibacter terrae TaxID=2586908 RepID=UPI002E2EECCF|nr:APH(3') family aminoglycoside O-phosphotransferase [Vineibacter terrae]HEX2887007.1 APH(3') family aminoglycoside O-phosphotransferase [Vineibacter terrae]
MTSSRPPLTTPRAWQSDLQGYAWHRQTIGHSDALVFRLEAEGRPTLFAKAEPAGPFSELPGEAARLRWLASRHVAAARVLAEALDEGRNWLLTTAVPGCDLASSAQLEPSRIVALAADALRDLHRIDIATCPFDHRLQQRITQARARVAAGVVDEGDFDDERLGRTASDLVEELMARQPQGEDLVVTHGDACLPNLLADAGLFTGFIDCGRLGVADRHQDLALTCWSIRHNLGEAWTEPFLRHYGGTVDRDKMAFYLLLDAFF